MRRKRYSDTHRRDEYVFTDAGAELVPVLIAVMAWAIVGSTAATARRCAYATAHASALPCRRCAARDAASRSSLIGG